MSSINPSVRFSDFARLAQLAAERDGFLWLEGVSHDFAGLESKDFEACGAVFDSDACGLSFCVNGRTFTAVEDGNDGYRSAMGGLFEREGNHCKNAFSPIPLALRLRESADDIGQEPSDLAVSEAREADMADLVCPETQRDILCVGTDYSEDYYPTFINHFSAEELTLALARFEAREIERVSERQSAPSAPGAHRL